MMPGWSAMLADGASAAERTELLNEIRRLQAAITAVSGWCIGGVDLIAATDIRLAAKDVRFSVREVRVAIVADLGSLQRLAGIIGDGPLSELSLTGVDVNVEHAARIGLVNDVYPDRNAVLTAAREPRVADDTRAPFPACPPVHTGESAVSAHPHPCRAPACPLRAPRAREDVEFPQSRWRSVTSSQKEIPPACYRPSGAKAAPEWTDDGTDGREPSDRCSGR
jgi:Enoyl-CoA hydratase/isomerase